MEIVAFHVKHGNKELFISALSGRVLADESRVRADVLSPSNKEGYQRESTPKRFREIGAYLATEDEISRATGPVLSQSLVLNTREPVEVRESELEGIVQLDLGDEYKLWEVDGQHRIGGIRDAIGRDERIADRMFPVVLLNGLTRFEEAVHFWLINDSQRRVPVDVAQRVIAQWSHNEDLSMLIRAQGKGWVGDALDVVDVINETEAQPWYRRIKVPGTKGARGRIVSQNAFAKSLKRLLEVPPYNDLPTESLAKLVIRYWTTIERVIPDAFEEPRQYVLQKTTGVEVMNRLMPAVFERVRVKHGRISEDGLEEVLRPLLSDGGVFWHGKGDGAAKYGTSNKGINLLADFLTSERLPKAQPSGLL